MASSTPTRPPSGFLPRDPRVEEPYRLTPQLALRIGILGAITLGVFGILFFRLWALQVLSTNQYLRAAQNNQLRTIRVEAPRGVVLDEHGKKLIDNKEATAVQVWPADLPDKPAARAYLLRRLARILDVPYPRIARDVRRHAGDPLAPVTVKEAAKEDEAQYLLEHESELPGVQIADTYVRRYPFQSLAAHVLGYVGEISPDQLKRLRKDGYELGDKKGQSGVESTYDRYLRGRPGRSQLRVDSMGRPRSDVTPTRDPVPGYSLRLTLDVNLQRAAERSLKEAIAFAKTQDCKGCWMADGGAIVAIDPRNGEIRALASNPTFQPRVYTSQNPRELRPLVNQKAAEAANFPALDRATQGLYPPGSTWKPVTALAAMQEHILAPYSTLPCTSTYTAGRDRQVFRNWTPMNAAMTLPTAIGASCDTYFYAVGDQFYKLPPNRGQPLQAWARRFGFGQKSGIDVGPEEPGLLPTIKWKQERFKDNAIEKLWKPGDSIQLAIGQKDLEVTPLQMAVFYSFIANGGKLVKPHVGSRIEDSTDSAQPIVRRNLAPAPPRDLNVDQGALAAIRDGLYKATHESYGTASSVFGAFPIPIAGKTGTAQKARDLGGYADLVDQSWFCGYGPTDKPELVVCTVVENGGFGGAVAAPATLKVFAKYFGIDNYSASYRQAD